MSLQVVMTLRGFTLEILTTRGEGLTLEVNLTPAAFTLVALTRAVALTSQEV